MKVKLLNTAMYPGLEDVVGKVLEASTWRNGVNIKGKELNTNGAKVNFNDEDGYYFATGKGHLSQEVDILEE